MNEDLEKYGAHRINVFIHFLEALYCITLYADIQEHAFYECKCIEYRRIPDYIYYLSLFFVICG